MRSPDLEREPRLPFPMALERGRMVAHSGALAGLLALLLALLVALLAAFLVLGARGLRGLRCRHGRALLLPRLRLRALLMTRLRLRLRPWFRTRLPLRPAVVAALLARLDAR